MVKFSSDVDILKYEPALFGELHLPGQVLASGSGAIVSGTTLTTADGHFADAGVTSGCVVYLRSTDGVLDGAFEIVAVDSATQLTVSVLRSDTTDAPIAPPAAEDVSYRIATFAPQAGEAAFRLTEYFGIQPGAPASEITPEDIMNTDSLRRASAFAVISSVYAMWSGRMNSEGFWEKSQLYKQLFENARQRCQLSADLGSDGVADVTRVGGSIRLMRD
jgi:hypothetical protein